MGHQSDGPTAGRGGERERCRNRKRVEKASCNRTEGVSVDHGHGGERVLRAEPVLALLDSLRRQGQFSLNKVRRDLKRMYARISCGPMAEVKPSGMHIHEMFCEEQMTPGDTTLSAESCPLKPAAMSWYHIKNCAECSKLKRVSESCYFFRMRECIEKGFAPKIVAPIVPRYAAHGNNSKAKVFVASFQAEVRKFVDEGVLEEVPDDEVSVTTINPGGITFKNSEVQKAATVTGRRANSQEELDSINLEMQEKGFSALKARVTVNSTQPGINDAVYKLRFSYASVSDLVQRVKRNDYLGKCDLSSYFTSFPLACKSRRLFGFIDQEGELRRFARIFFGLGPAPAFTSTFTAEFGLYARGEGLDPVYMVDDWAIRNSSLIGLMCALMLLTIMFTSMGFTLAAKKYGFGRRMVFLGVLFDTTTMKLSFDADASKYMLLLTSATIAAVQSNSSVTDTEWAHLAGKLNAYCEVLQLGRCKVAAVWVASRHYGKLTPYWISKLLADLTWWHDAIFSPWSASEATNKEFKIMSISEFESDASLMQVVQSDASGLEGHGIGYIHGQVDDLDPAFVSESWPDGYTPPSSMAGELAGLAHYAAYHMPEGKCVVWVSDSLSGVMAINSGRATEPVCGNWVELVLERCDELSCQIVALWVPREQNELADFLSHYAHSLGRSYVSGRVSELGGRPGQDFRDAMHSEEARSL